MNLRPGESRVDRYVSKEMRKELAKYCLKDKNGFSVIALNEQNELMGIKLGHKVTRGDKKPFLYSPWLKHFFPIMPRRAVQWLILAKYIEKELRYHPIYAMDDIGTRSLFIGELLCVSSKARGLGLGKEMVRLSMDLARKENAEAYFACVSGIYSQKIYRDLEFIVMKELAYGDVRDNRGRPLLNDTREHKKAQNVYKKL